jgi:hypothetical protein
MRREEVEPSSRLVESKSRVKKKSLDDQIKTAEQDIERIGKEPG